jgi:hypothetical protein
MRKKGDYLAHHYYDAEENGVPKLQIRPLVWGADGFPLAGEPLAELSSRPLTREESVRRLTTGTWKHSVNFGESVPTRLLASGKIQR